MTAGLFDVAPPLTRWQRFVARFLPWYDPDEQTKRIERTESIAKAIGRRGDIRPAYTQAGDRIERRSAPR